ncbi:unnamed protein product [Adineta steineri]|nr:unnamed protein product [Adineta steineri]CAF1109074.1 unnamed protein product [Adineta steineri]CAF1139682.1 unnamed protein product [Adineta steineri]CAF3573056.1 unnamed protein product [Adineta steineri]CAF3619014.1 unnamed protein product [Adineta steineri]
MDFHRPLSYNRQSFHSLPTVPQKTMDPKFIVVLFCVEFGALVFNSIHVKAPEMHIYKSYNRKPMIYNFSSQTYSCFSSINYCIYEHKQLRFLKIVHVIFISIIVSCYFGLITIIFRKWENSKVRHDLGITWYGAIQLLDLLTLALHTLLMVILYERDYSNIKQCHIESHLVRTENLFTYVVLSMLEIAYIGFDILNRQASIHALHQDFEYRARQAEQTASSDESNFRLKSHMLSTESFETVNQEFLPVTD